MESFRHECNAPRAWKYSNLGPHRRQWLPGTAAFVAVYRFSWLDWLAYFRTSWESTSRCPEWHGLYKIKHTAVFSSRTRLRLAIVRM